MNIRRNFVCHASSNYAHYALALYRSLESFYAEPSFTFFVICIDKQILGALSKLNLPSLVPVDLEDNASPELLSAKSNRTFREYCWTVTPFVFSLIYENYSDVDELIYLDADMQVISNPEGLLFAFSESGKDFGITFHGFHHNYDSYSKSGRYCVQFHPTRRSEGLFRILAFWQAACISWCYARYESGNFGDQVYLAEIMARFPRHVFLYPSLGQVLGPWGALRFPPSEVIIYHFHGLRVLSGKYILFSTHQVPHSTWVQIYLPYIELLKDVINELRTIEFKNQQSMISLSEQPKMVIYFCLEKFLNMVYPKTFPRRYFIISLEE